MTSSGLSAWIWLGARVQLPTGRSICVACTTQVEAF